MKKEAIIKLPDNALRQPSKKVSEITPKVTTLINDMVSASLDWESSRPHEISAALAAVQVNEHTKVIIIRNSFDDKEDDTFTALVNPKITKYSDDTTEDFEGCLSVNGIYGKVKRANRIKLKALNKDGEEVRLKAEGFLARVIQHEVDHCNGIVFIDHIKNKKDGFFKLNDAGELDPLDYDKHIKDNHELWD